jgi:hypothetical protein
MLTFILFLFTGTIGFLACFWFVRIIYYILKTHMKKIAIIAIPGDVFK